MYSIYTKKIGWPKKLYHKILLIMRLTTVILIASLMQVSASTLAQRINVHQKNALLENVLKEIRKQSGYDFFYDAKLTESKKISQVSLTNVTIDEALKTVLKDLPLIFEIEGKTVSITKKEPSFLDRVMSAFADINVHGIVVDDQGRPLVGATVAVLQTGGNANFKQAVMSNAKGEFLLRNVDERDMILVSFIGYVPQQFKASKDMGTIKMVAISGKLNEVIVKIVNTGYQKIKREQLTGAVVSLDSAAYHQSISVNGNLLNNLEGRLSGLVYNPNRGELSVRGVSTLRGITQPLIVLDGYPTELQLDQINSQDIVSVNVLKDAASAAIYGVRASNGVIVIETKAGKPGPQSINLNVNYSISVPKNLSDYHYLKGMDYVQAKIAMAKSDIANGNTKAFFTSSNRSYSPILGITDDLKNNMISQEQANAMYAEYGAYDNTRDFEKLFTNAPVSKNVDFNISGGTQSLKKVTYFFGLNFQENHGDFKNNNDNRLALTFNSVYDLSKIFKLSVKSYYTLAKTNAAQTPSYGSFDPYEHFIDEQGNALPTLYTPSYANLGGGASTLSINDALAKNALAKGLYDPRYYPYLDFLNQYQKMQKNNFRVVGDLTTKIANGLNFVLGGSYERQVNINTDYMGEMASETRAAMDAYTLMDPSGKPVFQLPQGAIQKTTNSLMFSYTIRGLFNFDRVFNKHAITVLLGAEQRKIVTDNALNTMFGYDDQLLTSKPMNYNLFNGVTSSPFSNDFLVKNSKLSGYYLNNFISNTNTDNRFVSVFGNASYTYNGKYTATGSFRIDQSNLFGTSPRFRYTPLLSGGILWAIKKESVLKDVEWVNGLSLRTSIGYNGNTAKGAGPYTIISALTNSLAGPNTVVGNYITSAPNSELRWERTFNKNIGLDFSVLANRISGSVDYYTKHSKDLVESMFIDPTYGGNGSGLMANNAEVMNKGIEISLNSQNISNSNFNWSTSLSASFNNSELLAFNYNRVQSATDLVGAFASAPRVIGKELQPVYSYKYAGLDQNGRPQAFDDMGNKIVPGGSIFAPVSVPVSALNYEGTQTPRYVVGLSNQFSYRDFSLATTIMYYGGHVGQIPAPIIKTTRPIEGALNYWQKPGDENFTDIPGFPGGVFSPTYFSTAPGGALDAYQYGHQFFKRMDYLAIRNITISYKLQKNFLKKLGLSNTLLQAQVLNPYKLPFYVKGIDPEVLGFGMPTLHIKPTYTISMSTKF